MPKEFNTKNSLEDHKNLIKKKGLLHKIYLDFYQSLKPKGVPKGPIVEIGSGGGFLKEIIPEAITSDVIAGPGIDKVFFAEKMPFKKNSVSAFLMIDVLHHIKDSRKAFTQMQRCLNKHGKIIMIEPFNSLWGYFIYKYLHYEHFDPSAGWEVKGKGRMSDSNTALPWIIFVRDRKVFKEKFPNLQIVRVQGHSPFRYLLSGGLTKPQFAPTFTYPLIKFIEDKLLSPFGNLIGMFVTIELQKN